MDRVMPPQALKGKLLVMMVLRVVLAFAFLGVTTWFQVRAYTAPPEGAAATSPSYWALYAVVAAIGGLTIVYALLLGRVRNLRRFAYLQVGVDVALITLIVFVTGGAESYLSTLYLLAVIGSSIVLSRRGGVYAAALSSIAYGAMVDMDFYGMLPRGYKLIDSAAVLSWEDVFTTVATNILAFFTVAWLTGYLAERTMKVERRLEEREIDFEKLEALNRNIVENITSGIMTLDETHRITSFNQAAEVVTGHTLREVYYKDVDRVLPGLIADSTTPDGMREEGRFIRKDDTEIFLGFTISPGSGGEASKIVIFQDLTRLKAMEEQLRRDERLKALGELSVGIAHEIRNPLASISGSIQVLREDTPMNDDNRRLMDIVLRETERLNGLITDYLLFARPAREKTQPVDVSMVLYQTLEMLRNSPEASTLDIDCDVAPGIVVEADERQMGQVFWNLFVNAAHAIGEKGERGRLRVSSRPASRSGEGGREMVELRVADNGSGIEPEVLERIFDPFFSTKAAGTGLGLAVVHRIIEAHGGRITVASGRGEGTAFRVELPLADEQASAGEGGIEVCQAVSS